MSNQVFKQNLDDKKGPQPGGPYLIQMLFKEPVDMPDNDEMTAVMEKHIGAHEAVPQPVRPFPELAPEAMRSILHEG